MIQLNTGEVLDQGARTDVRKVTRKLDHLNLATETEPRSLTFFSLSSDPGLSL